MGRTPNLADGSAGLAGDCRQIGSHLTIGALGRGGAVPSLLEYAEESKLAEHALLHVAFMHRTCWFPAWSASPERGIEHRVVPWCERHKVAVVGYSPFGHSGFPGPRTRVAMPCA